MKRSLLGAPQHVTAHSQVGTFSGLGKGSRTGSQPMHNVVRRKKSKTWEKGYREENRASVRVGLDLAADAGLARVELVEDLFRDTVQLLRGNGAVGKGRQQASMTIKKGGRQSLTSRGKSRSRLHARSSDSKMVRFSLVPCLTNSFSNRPRNSSASCLGAWREFAADHSPEKATKRAKNAPSLRSRAPLLRPQLS